MLLISRAGDIPPALMWLSEMLCGALLKVSESAPAAEVRELIMKELPETPGFIADMFSGMAEMMSH